MLKVRIFLNEPRGKSWQHFIEMLSRLGGTYELEVATTSKPKPEYHTDAYYALDLPVAPAVMIEEEIIVEGKDIDEAEFEAAIRRHLGLP